MVVALELAQHVDLPHDDGLGVAELAVLELLQRLVQIARLPLLDNLHREALIVQSNKIKI